MSFSVVMVSQKIADKRKFYKPEYPYALTKNLKKFSFTLVESLWHE